jgi:type VI secretion system protein ImpF
MSTQDRLQPTLLDRLCDHAPHLPTEADDQRVMNKQQIRAAVLRDLSWLFNAVQPLAGMTARYPRVAKSVLNYGLPPISGQTASQLDVAQLEQSIRDAILQFEPRILAEHLKVRALEFDNLLETHNIIEFEISGQLWAQPVPLELLLRTQLDLELGQVLVKDAGGGVIQRQKPY